MARWREAWAGFSLARQFALAGGIVMLIAALVTGSVVARRIEEVVVRNTANATALYMESVIAPATQELMRQESLSARSRNDIGAILGATALGRKVVSYKVWRKGGHLQDASNKALVGQTFAPTENLALAWQGEVRADFEETGDAEDVAENALGLPLLEIYVPIRSPATGEVLAVVEFYEVADGLRADILRARALAWASVMGVMAAVGAALFAIVLRGSRTIDAQIIALREASAANLGLRLQMHEASARAATTGEEVLRKVGADLHDGPAQLMAFAALRLDALRGRVEGEAARADLTEVTSAVGAALSEIRNISRGLSAPDLERRDLGGVLRNLVEAHAARTGTEVELDLPEGGLPPLDPALALCLYRFAQEGLTNAWRHGGGAGQVLRVRAEGPRLVASVLDRGPGFAPGAGESEGRLGLSGLRHRVEALGGRLVIHARTDGPGAELRMEIETGGKA